MGVGEAIALSFGGVSTVTLLVTFYLLRSGYRKKMDEAARILGIEREMAAELEKKGSYQELWGWAIPSQ